MVMRMRWPAASALAAGWLAGAALALAGHALPALPLLGAAALGALAATFFDRRGAVVLAAALGALWTTHAASHALAARLDPALAGRTLLVTARVADIPRREPGRLRFTLAGARAWVDGRQVRVPRRMAITWYRPAGVLPRAGERWRFALRLHRPRSLSDPSVFDYTAWTLAHGIGAVGYVYRDRAARLEPAAGSLLRLRARIARSVSAALPDDPYAGLVAGLAVGARGGVTDAQWRTLRATGTSHLLAISGLHLGLVAVLVFVLVDLLARRVPALVRRVPARLVAAAAAALAALGYATLAGFGLPTQRALIMLALPLLALALRRRLAVADALAVAAVLVILVTPLAILSASFWLSFGAVTALVYGLRSARPGRGLVRAQLVVSLGLVPLAAAFFGAVSLVGPVANLVAIPVVGWTVVPAALSGALATLVHPGWGVPFFHAAAWVLARLWPCLQWLAGLPGAKLALGPPTWPVLAAAAAGAICLLAPRGLGVRLAGVALVLPLVWPPLPARPHAGDFRVTVLDVGQGLAAVVTTADHVLLVDTGPRWWGENSAGREIVLPYLRAQGLGRPDLVVLSHADADHAGGLAAIEERWPRLPVLSSARAGVHRCHAGERWEWDGVTFAVLGPRTGIESSRNNRSCVLRVAGPGGTVLFPGDIEAAGEGRLLARAAPRLAADVVLAPHHGSLTSSTPGFVAAVHPDYVVFATGYRNRYGFPRPAIVARYRAAGAMPLDTAHDGAIVFSFTAAHGVRLVERYRRTHRRPWTDP